MQDDNKNFATDIKLHASALCLFISDQDETSCERLTLKQMYLPFDLVMGNSFIPKILKSAPGTHYTGILTQ